MSKADDLQVRAEAFADLSIQFVAGLPQTVVAQKIGGQYLGAATSVAANYRAARKGRSYAEFTAKVGIVAEEADESLFWLHRLANAGISSSVDAAPLLHEAEELAKIFAATARTARSRSRRRSR
jgi:four helix bundle protein